MTKRISRFVANEDDDLHCLQAAYAMVVDAMAGAAINMAVAESETGFVPGKGTWPFIAMRSLVEGGFFVVDDEAFDIDLFVADPKAAILGQNADESVTEAFLADLGTADMEAALFCHRSASVAFTKSSPAIADFDLLFQHGGIPMVQINSSRLAGREGYMSHFVVVESIADGQVILQDPGLPPRENWGATVEQFVQAWLDPSPEMANLIGVLPTEEAFRAYVSSRNQQRTGAK